MIQVGQKVQFDALYGCNQGAEKLTAHTVGTVVYVNERHKWFSVQFGKNQRTSFKFSEIGEIVKLCTKRVSSE